jgi:hypothetical protein
MKNQKLAILTVISVCWLAIFGCAPSDSDSSSSGREKSLTGLIADLQGVWTTEWYRPYGFGGDLGKDTFVVSGTNITWQKSYTYDTSFLPFPTNYKQKYTGDNLNIGEMTILDDGTVGYRFTYRFQTASETLLDDSIVETSNAVSSCGIENWQKNVSVDLIGKSCFHTKVKKDTEIPNVVKLVDGRLYLGLTELHSERWELDDSFESVEPSLTVYSSAPIAEGQVNEYGSYGSVDVPFTKQ